MAAPEDLALEAPAAAAPVTEAPDAAAPEPEREPVAEAAEAPEPLMLMLPLMLPLMLAEREVTAAASDWMPLPIEVYVLQLEVAGIE